MSKVEIALVTLDALIFGYSPLVTASALGWRP